MDEEERRYREVEKRERLIQTFLIIGGFFVAYTREEFQQYIVLFFSAYLITAILYYVSLSRTNNNQITDYLALLSSYVFSFIILIFIANQGVSLKEDLVSFFLMLILLTGILTFALLSPEGSGMIGTGIPAMIKGLIGNYSGMQEKLQDDTGDKLSKFNFTLDRLLRLDERVTKAFLKVGYLLLFLLIAAYYYLYVPP